MKIIKGKIGGNKYWLIKIGKFKIKFINPFKDWFFIHNKTKLKSIKFIFFRISWISK